MISSNHNYDLFERRDGWVAEMVLIISPYVEKDFFACIARDLRPKQLRVVIDDGCRREDLETVRSAIAECGSKPLPKLTCKLGSAPGLVHLKLFYVVWRTSGGQTARTLVYGSANATRQGFSGSMNAELLAHCRLVASRHQPVIDWCEEVIDATRGAERIDIEARRDVELGKGFYIRLPKISVGRDVPTLSNLDIWIQRGSLLSEYRPDPSFLRVPIHLKKGLDPAEQARAATIAGFAVPQMKRLNYAYLSPTSTDLEDDSLSDDEGTEEGEAGNWRRKFFVWTQLGDWCSEACYDKNQDQFRKRGFEDRSKQLENLAELRIEANFAASRERFLTRLSNLWRSFGADAPMLLQGENEVNEVYYAGIFKTRVDRDLELAGDDEFTRRYIRGYELVQVPRFRNDISGWQDFMKSLARQLCLDASRVKSQSKFLLAAREVLKEVGKGEEVLDGPDPLLRFLREIWQGSFYPNNTEAIRILSEYHLR